MAWIAVILFALALIAWSVHLDRKCDAAAKRYFDAVNDFHQSLITYIKDRG